MIEHTTGGKVGSAELADVHRRDPLTILQPAAKTTPEAVHRPNAASHVLECLTTRSSATSTSPEGHSFPCRVLTRRPGCRKYLAARTPARRIRPGRRT